MPAAVDTVGSIEVIEQFQQVVRRYGHIVSAGFYGTQDAMALQPLRYGEYSVDLVSGWQPRRMDETLHLIAAGQLQTLPLITHRFPAAQAADAWALIESKREPILGVISLHKTHQPMHRTRTAVTIFKGSSRNH